MAWIMSSFIDTSCEDIYVRYYVILSVLKSRSPLAKEAGLRWISRAAGVRIVQTPSFRTHYSTMTSSLFIIDFYSAVRGVYWMAVISSLFTPQFPMTLILSDKDHFGPPRPPATFRIIGWFWVDCSSSTFCSVYSVRFEWHSFHILRNDDSTRLLALWALRLMKLKWINTGFRTEYICHAAYQRFWILNSLTERIVAVVMIVVRSWRGCKSFRVETIDEKWRRLSLISWINGKTWISVGLIRTQKPFVRERDMQKFLIFCIQGWIFCRTNRIGLFSKSAKNLQNFVDDVSILLK